jgi:hypothetical protein
MCRRLNFERSSKFSMGHGAPGHGAKIKDTSGQWKSDQQVTFEENPWHWDYLKISAFIRG